VALNLSAILCELANWLFFLRGRFDYRCMDDRPNDKLVWVLKILVEVKPNILHLRASGATTNTSYNHIALSSRYLLMHHTRR